MNKTLGRLALSFALRKLERSLAFWSISCLHSKVSQFPMR